MRCQTKRLRDRVTNGIIVFQSGGELRNCALEGRSISNRSYSQLIYLASQEGLTHSYDNRCWKEVICGVTVTIFTYKELFGPVSTVLSAICYAVELVRGCYVKNKLFCTCVHVYSMGGRTSLPHKQICFGDIRQYTLDNKCKISIESCSCVFSCSLGLLWFSIHDIQFCLVKSQCGAIPALRFVQHSLKAGFGFNQLNM